jgi:hypothetical protein
MISGMRYCCEARGLEVGRVRTQILFTEFNAHVPKVATIATPSNDRMQPLQKLFSRAGNNSFVELCIQVDYGCNISVGERFYTNFNQVSRTAT